MKSQEQNAQVTLMWLVAKAVFGIVVMVGMGLIRQGVAQLETSIQKINSDHEQIGLLEKQFQVFQKQSNQTVITLKQYGKAIQENTDTLRAMSKERRKH